MIPVFTILHYNRPDLLRRCIESIDYPVAKLVVIHGGPGALPDVDWPACIASKEFLFIPGGGVSNGINLTLKTFPAPWWFISSNDIQFRPGDLKAMAEAADQNPRLSAVFGKHAAAYQIITRHGLETVGLYDENFHPMYLEDYDWIYRCRLAGGAIMHRMEVNALHGMNGEPNATVNADRALKAKHERNWPILCDYYARKWGGEWSKETFTTPFGNPSFPVTHWSYEPELREKLRW